MCSYGPGNGIMFSDGGIPITISGGYTDQDLEDVYGDDSDENDDDDYEYDCE